MSLTPQQIQERIDQALQTRRSRGLVREPVMATLPVATLAATVIYKLPGGVWSTSPWGALVAGLVVSLALYAIDLTTLSTEERRGGNAILRLAYAGINTLLLAGLLTGIISPEQLGLGGTQ
jgi:hypothetical protein